MFLVGAIAASATWFFSLGFGAARLAPFLKKTTVWRVLDGAIGMIMTLVAASLVRKALS